ncbi:MAG: hypothetical protein Q8T08_06465 [Ignavibacteria bacterium]|nr:hypothetical protein [Ignavibacteria bacterium]
MKKASPFIGTSLFEQPNKGTKKTNYRKSEAIKYLETIADEAARKRYPNTPPHYLAPRTFRDDTANGLTQCIIQFIRLKGGQAERINSTGRRIDTRTNFFDVVGFQRSIVNTHWIPGTGTNGTADISATIAGRSVKVEVKIGADRQSQAQKDYQQAVQQAGGIYVIASTFEGFLTWFNLTFKP